MEFPGKNTVVGCHFLLPGIFPTQGSIPCLLCLLPWQADSFLLLHLGSLPSESPLQQNEKITNTCPMGFPAKYIIKCKVWWKCCFFRFFINSQMHVFMFYQLRNWDPFLLCTECVCFPCIHMLKSMDFPGGPVAKTLCSQGMRPGFHPWSGNITKSSHAATKNPACHRKNWRPKCHS